jgi:23S rRNA pseudouridine2605 synthase
MTASTWLVVARELCYQAATLSTRRPMSRKSEHDRKTGERIAKAMARAGLASRREAEAWVAAGRVAVNGEVITSPAVKVGAKDRVTVDGKPLPQRERTRLFLFHKPRGLVTTNFDPEGRRTVFDALPKNLPRLITVGRLDFNTEGLLLLTNDGGLARVLEHPDTGWLRRYRVRAHGSVTQAQLDALREGITVDGIRYGPIEATLDRPQGSNVWLIFAIREGKNREVRNVLRALDLNVNRLIRVSFGPFQLGELEEGKIEEVKMRVLREQLGRKIAAQAGVDFDAPVTAREEAGPERKGKPRHPEARSAEGREPRRMHGADRGRSSFEGRMRRPPQDDGERQKRSAPQDDGEKPTKPRPWRGRGRDRPITEPAPENDKPRTVKAGLLTDRKGRRVLVQRVQPDPSAEPQEPPREQRYERPSHGRPRGKSPRDRRSGPRPARPRSAGEGKRR